MKHQFIVMTAMSAIFALLVAPTSADPPPRATPSPTWVRSLADTKARLMPSMTEGKSSAGPTAAPTLPTRALGRRWSTTTLSCGTTGRCATSAC